MITNEGRLVNYFVMTSLVTIGKMLCVRLCAVCLSLRVLFCVFVYDCVYLSRFQ